MTNREKNSIIDKLNKARPVGQAVKTLASHAENMGSIPVRVTNEKRTLFVGVLFFVDVIPSGSTHPENLRFSGYGFAFAARRSASLFARRRASKYSPLAKFPYGLRTKRIRTPHSPSAFVSHIVGSVHSPRSARNAGHRFTKNSYQPFFPRSPYLFGARDTISTNYTCCALCTFHLLASQYTAFAICTKKQHTDAPLLW